MKTYAEARIKELLVLKENVLNKISNNESKKYSKTCYGRNKLILKDNLNRIEKELLDLNYTQE